MVIQRARNLITEIKNEEGVIVNGREAITDLPVDYFRKRWAFEYYEDMEVDLSCVPHVLSEADNLDLCRPITEEEIEDVVMSMPRDKAPSPDGIPVEFYMKCWRKVKVDFVASVKHLFDTFHLPPQWKATFIALIPKIKSPSVAKDYRPISLCNACYKVCGEDPC